MNAASVSLRPSRFARGAGLVVIGAGTAGAIGWALEIPALTSGLPGLPRMAPRTAVMLLFTGSALLCVETAQSARIEQPKWPGAASALPWVARGCAAFALLISLATLTNHISMLGANAWPAWNAPPGAAASGMVVAPATALSLVCLSGAIFLASGSRLAGLCQALALGGGVLAWPGVTHYLLGVPPLASHALMAAPTAVALLFLSAGTLSSRPDVGLMALLVSEGPGGLAARRLLPAMMLVPILLGWLHAHVQRAGWYDAEAGLSALAVGNALVFGGIIWMTALQLHRNDLQRQRAVEALRASEQQLQAIADNSTAVIYVKDLEGRYLLVNRRFEDLFHRRRDVVAGMTDYDLFPREAADAFRAMDVRALAAGAAVQGEEMVPQDEGLHTYVSVKYPLRNAAGAFYATCGISTDITERIRAEQAQRESEARTRAIFDIAFDGIIVMDADGCIAEFNRAAERIFGYRRDDVLGRALADVIIPPARREQHNQGLARYLATGDGPVLGRQLEMVGLRADGSELPVELSIARMPGGGAPLFTGFLRDITERKQAEHRRHREIERLRLLDQITRAIGERHDLRSVFQVVIGSLEDNLPIDFGCVCLYDAIAETLTVSVVGVRSAALAADLAMTAHARIDIDQNGLSRCVRGELAYEPDIRQAASPFARRLSRRGLASVVLAPLQSESTVFGVLVAARRQPGGFSSGDCEFLRQLSGHVALAAHQAQILAALQQAYDDLRQTQHAVMQQERLRALGQMASGIAHDINNAVSPVALYTQSLLETEPNLSARARDYLETTQRAIEDVAHTVARMREFYREPEPQAALAPVQMNNLVQQVADLTRARWSDMPQQRGVVIALRLELAPDLPAVAGIESDIREALTNLVFNAVDAMPDGGTLTARTTLESGASDRSPLAHVHVDVADTGIGMDDDTRRRCLEPFFTTKGERGTGLGLAMVYGIVQRHGGEIVIDSAAGRGTTVRLRFPVPLATAAAAATAGAISAPARRTRILLVDDDPLLIKSLRDILEADGHIVTAATGGQEGIDVFRAAEARGDRFALVITDLGMPYVDGRRVASAVKAMRASTAVILLTGWGHRLVADGDVPSHVDLVLNKPPKLRDLRNALAELTAKYASNPPV